MATCALASWYFSSFLQCTCVILVARKKIKLKTEPQFLAGSQLHLMGPVHRA